MNSTCKMEWTACNTVCIENEREIKKIANVKLAESM